MRVRVPPGVPYGSLAQLAEHLAVNQGVAGSSPAGIAIAGETWSVEWRMPTLKSLPSLCQGMCPTGDILALVDASDGVHREGDPDCTGAAGGCRIGRNRTWNSVGNW